MVHGKHPLSANRIGGFIAFLRSLFDALGETYCCNKKGLIFSYVVQLSINFMKTDVSGRKIPNLLIWISLTYNNPFCFLFEIPKIILKPVFSRCLDLFKPSTALFLAP